MFRPKLFLLAALVMAAHAPVGAQTAPSTSCTLVVVSATGEVRAANDQVTVTFVVEEQDKDKKAAAARVNRKMKEGTEIVRRADPTAELKTQGYTTYAVYPERPEPPRPASRTRTTPEAPIGWRVRQTLQVKTMNLADLPKTVAAGQKTLEVEGLQFGVSPAVERRLDDQRIAETYRNLNERIVSIARAMGRQPGDAALETVDFEGSGNYTQQRVEVTGSRIRRENLDIPEPSFEPGETTLQMRLVGKVRFR